MNNILYKLKQIFWPSTASSDTKHNMFIFELLNNGTIKTKLKFQSTDKEASENMGAFLYELTSGLISEHIVDVMLGLAEDYPQYSHMIKDSILIWSKHVKQNKNDKSYNDKPIISPTKFSSYK